MRVGFIGDVHGRVFHALAAVATWQQQTGKRCDLLIQVGDLGAFPDLTQLDPATNRYLAIDPAEADFSRLLTTTGKRAAALRRLRQWLASPIYFIRGNHEDFAWLDQLVINTNSGTAPVDPFDLFRYVPDGSLLQWGGIRFAFLGGVEERTDRAAIDRKHYQSLLTLGEKAIDILVTHQGPYGSSLSRQGEIYGSPLISNLLAHTQPKFHVAGHAHALSGPRLFGGTLYLGLDNVVASPIWHPEAKGLQAGWLASLDTETNELQPVTDAWLSTFPKPFDFDRWLTKFSL